MPALPGRRYFFLTYCHCPDRAWGSWFTRPKARPWAIELRRSAAAFGNQTKPGIVHPAMP